DTVDGDELVIDKAFNTRIKFKINSASANFPELGAVNDWLPMYFRSFDVSVNGVGTSNAEFSDLELMTEAYSAATGQRIFTIRSPRYEKTNRSASSTLTFDQDFFDDYMKFNTRYSIHVHPDQVYG